MKSNKFLFTSFRSEIYVFISFYWRCMVWKTSLLHILVPFNKPYGDVHVSKPHTMQNLKFGRNHSQKSIKEEENKCPSMFWIGPLFFIFFEESVRKDFMNELNQLGIQNPTQKVDLLPIYQDLQLNRFSSKGMSKLVALSLFTFLKLYL